MSGERFRLCYTLNSEQHVSSVVLSAEEVNEHLDLEATLHEKAGWTVTRGDNIVVCRRGKSVRIIESKVFSPLDDLP